MPTVNGLIRYGGVVAGQEEIDAAIDVLTGQGWASGPVTARFEQAAATVQGRAHALFVNSGSSALLLALATLSRGSKIAMPALQFPTLYSAALWCGLEPVLVDIDDSLNISPAGLAEAHLDHDLDAVAFVHMAGNPSGIAEIAEYCQMEDLILIEDVCEAFGASTDGIPAGNFGLASATSTHAAHQISTGEGGLVFTSSRDVYEQMRRIRDWGRAYSDQPLLGGYYPGYVFSEPGLNLHASDIQAAVGLVQLGRLDGFAAARRRNYEYLAGKAQLPFTRPRVDEGCEPSWYTFPVLAGSSPARDRLAGHLQSRAIESRPVVAGNMARQPVTGGAWDPGQFPVADMVFQRGLWVSVHQALTEGDLERIAAALNEFQDW